MAKRLGLGGGVLAVALVACGPSASVDAGMDGGLADGAVGGDATVDGNVATDGGLTTDGGVTGLAVVQSPTNVLAYTVTFTTPRVGPPELTVACRGLEPWTLRGEHEATEHEVFVMGLVAQQRCTFFAGLVDTPDEARASIEVEVAPLPEYLPEIEVTTAATGAAHDGWTLTNLSNGRDRYAYTVALIDLEGRIRWYYQYPDRWQGADSPVLRFGDGVLVGGRGIPATEVSWDGRQVWVGPGGHHEVRPSLEPNRVYVLTDERACNGQEYGAAGIVEWDYVTAEETWHWYMCDHYTPNVDVHDWSHVNTIAHVGDGASLLLSSRNQNSIMLLDRASGDIVWSMGFDGRPEDGFHGDFEMEEADRFFQQHDPEVLEDGHIVLFDNGHPTERRYSRAIEIAYEYDPEGTSRAWVVWEYRHEPDLYTPVWGDADRLENGNTLVTFGRSDAIDRTRIVEVTPEGDVAWEIAMPLHWGSYRAERITDLPLGFVRE